MKDEEICVDRVLFKAEGWAVCRYSIGSGAVDAVHGHHIGCKGMVQSLHWERWESQFCYNCLEPVPEGIVALVMLHSWDLQENEA